MTPRSYLYVPGHRGDRLEKALASDADAIIADLEDAVPFAQKPEARATVRSFVNAASDPDEPEVWVRINPPHLDEDVEVAAGPRTRGVVLPKADPDSLARLDECLERAERRTGRPVGSLAVIPLIETAAGALALPAIAAAPRVVRIGIGEADLVGELGLQPDEQRTELWSIRLTVVLASAAAGLARPIGPVLTAVHDDDLLETTTQTLRRQGFRARTAIHPRQLTIINQTFTPSDDEVARARAALAAFAEQEAAGQGAFVDEAGQLVDAATIRASRDIVATAERLAARAQRRLAAEPGAAP